MRNLPKKIQELHVHEETVTVHENKAPTDDSIRLYEEMREKAHSDVAWAYVSNRDNQFQGAVTVFRDAMVPDNVVHVNFVLNGVKYENRIRISEHELAASGSAERLLKEAIATAVAEKLLGNIR